jgi:hypothetical protein
VRRVTAGRRAFGQVPERPERRPGQPGIPQRSRRRTRGRTWPATSAECRTSDRTLAPRRRSAAVGTEPGIGAQLPAARPAGQAQRLDHLPPPREPALPEGTVSRTRHRIVAPAWPATGPFGANTGPPEAGRLRIYQVRQAAGRAASTSGAPGLRRSLPIPRPRRHAAGRVARRGVAPSSASCGDVAASEPHDSWASSVAHSECGVLCSWVHRL